MLSWLNDILKPDTVPGETEVLINLLRYITFRAGHSVSALIQRQSSLWSLGD